MVYFFWEFIVLAITTVVFYIIFFSLIYYWHEANVTFVIVPLIYAFEFFLLGFVIILLFSLIRYLPDILTG